MADRKTVSTRIGPETDEQLQTVADARSVSKADYIREAVKDALSSDHDDLTEDDQIMARMAELERSVEGEGTAESDDSGKKRVEGPGPLPDLVF